MPSGYFGTDFSTTTPADSDAIRDGAFQIRDLKSRVLAFLGVKFVLTDGTFTPGIIKAADIASNTSNGSDGTRAINFEHIRLNSITNDKLLDTGATNPEAAGGTYSGIQASKLGLGSVIAGKILPDSHFLATVTSNSTTAYVVTISPAPILTSDKPPMGTVIRCQVPAANANTTSTPTMLLPGQTTPRTIVKRTPLAASTGLNFGTSAGGGDIIPGQLMELVFDATNSVWVLMNPATGSNVRVSVLDSTNCPATAITRSIAHGLPVTPTSVRVVLVAQANEASYVTGEEVPLQAFYQNNGTFNCPCFSYFVDATNVIVLVAFVPNRVADKTGSITAVAASGAPALLTNWRLKIYVSP